MSTEVSTEIAHIHEVMRDDPGTYRRDESMQGRLRDLYDARDRGAPAPAPLKRNEIEEIKAVLRNDPRRYWRSPEMQERFRLLLEAESPEPVETEDDGGGLVRLGPPSEWVRNGGNPAEYGPMVNLIRNTNDVLSGMSAADRQHVSASFERLPEVVRNAAFAELMSRRTVPTERMTDAEMRALSHLPSYPALLAEWGQEAPERMARYRERLFRISERIPDAQIPVAVAWLDQQPKGAIIALAKKLGA